MIVTESHTSKTLVEHCAQWADEKKAKDIVVIDLQGVDGAPASYFMVCTAESEIQGQTIADYLVRAARTDLGERAKVEGKRAARWIVVDFFDVVIHIFQAQERVFYNLEKIWSDGKFLSLSLTGKVAKLQDPNTQDTEQSAVVSKSSKKGTTKKATKSSEATTVRKTKSSSTIQAADSVLDQESGESDVIQEKKTTAKKTSSRSKKANTEEALGDSAGLATETKPKPKRTRKSTAVEKE